MSSSTSESNEAPGSEDTNIRALAAQPGTHDSPSGTTPGNAGRRSWLIHFTALAVLAFLAGLLTLREPGTGDDLTYWIIAFNIHDQGLGGWYEQSFHNLRWPVWGVCWLIQAVLGFNMAAYSGTGLLYLAAGTILCASFGRLLFRTPGAAWACGIAYLFHPLIDTLCNRPMPDASEGVWGGAAMLCWWALMQARTRRRAITMAVLTGACVFIVQANRLTGVFIIPVMTLCTLLFFRQRFAWLVLAGAASAVFYGLECLFYRRLFGEWLYNLNTNMLGKGVEGTEPVALWYLPFRFLDTLWDTGSPFSPVYTLLALLGIWAAWSGRAGVFASKLSRPANLPSESSHNATILARVLVVWSVVLYLEYACAPQSLSPWRPVVRDGDRFLASLAVPMSIVAVCGITALLGFIAHFLPRLGRWPVRHPFVTASAAVLLLAYISLPPRREFSHFNYLSAMREYQRSIAPGTQIYTYREMRALAHLADSASAQSFKWLTTLSPMMGMRRNEKLIAKADEFWYMRKQLWQATQPVHALRESGMQVSPASCFADARDEWKLTAVLTIGDTPDLHFFRRRTPGSPAPMILDAQAPELAELIPALEAERQNQLAKKPRSEIRWALPQSFRGKRCRIEFQPLGDKSRPIEMGLIFLNADGETQAKHTLEARAFPMDFRDTLAFEVPASAKECIVKLECNRKVKQLPFENFRMIVE